ncbi:MAG: hypothetical protein HZA48_10430 [Planctomycetes bacterium]|nr:hypothetical protein [Planctomycetota bacterium]
MLLKNDIFPERIDLSTRAVNALHKAGYNSFSKCANITFGELLDTRNIGIKTANEIFNTFDSFRKKCNEHQLLKITLPGSFYDKRKHKYFINLLAIPVSKIKLSVRAMRVLKKTKTQSMLELVQSDAGKILQIRGCGVKTIREIGDFLKHLELQPGKRPDDGLVRDVKKHMAEREAGGILEDFSRDYPDKYDLLTKVKAVNFTVSRIKFYKDCFRAYKELGTLESVGKQRGLTRERVRQILEQGTRLGLFNYARKEPLCFSKNKIIKSFSKHLSICGVSRANGISEARLRRMLAFHKITGKELAALRLSVTRNRCMEFFRRIVAKSGHSPSSSELQKKKKTRNLYTRITVLWGSMDAFRKELRISKPAYRRIRKNL